MSEEGEDDVRDELPALIASIDQMLAIMPERARALKGIYDSHLEAGFDEEQAWNVCRLYLMEWIG